MGWTSLDLPCLKRQLAVLTAVEGGGSRLKLDCDGHWMMSIPGPLLVNQEEIWSPNGFTRYISLNSVPFQVTDDLVQIRFLARASYQKSGLPLVSSSFKISKNKWKRGINFRERWVKRAMFYNGSDTVTEHHSFFQSHHGLTISDFSTSHQKARVISFCRA
jgi:hypothetical protein